MIPILLSEGYFYNYRTNDLGEKIPGIKIPVIINNGGYQLTDIIVYKDAVIGMVGGNTIEEFINYLESGYIVFDIQPNSDIYVYNLGILNVANFESFKSKEELIKEVEDCISRLNGKTTRIQRCRDLFKQYLLEDSESNFELLNHAYYDVPRNKRVMFEYTENKDPLCQLMTNKTKYIREVRLSFLNEYFENEWTNEEFK